MFLVISEIIWILLPFLYGNIQLYCETLWQVVCITDNFSDYKYYDWLHLLEIFICVGAVCLFGNHSSPVTFYNNVGTGEIPLGMSQFWTSHCCTVLAPLVCFKSSAIQLGEGEGWSLLSFSLKH